MRYQALPSQGLSAWQLRNWSVRRTMSATKLRLAKSPKTETALERAMGDYLSAVRARGGSPRTEQYYPPILWRGLLPWTAPAGITQPEPLDQRVLHPLNAHPLRGTHAAPREPLSPPPVPPHL